MKMNRIIREKRKNLGMTQEQMAAYLGVSASAVNKWEKGSTCPDIALLPGLARLLQTDLNTLLSFKEDLCDAEIENFVNAVNETVREKGYEKGYQMAMNKIHEYPTCEPLLYSLILYLDGARFLYSVPEQEGHGEVFETFYERLSESEIPVIRETALTMLISASRNRKDFARAEELIEKLPAADVVEVRHGKNISSGKDGDWFRCSECNYAMRDYYSEDETIMPKNELQYCPNCGARMDKGEEIC